MIEHLDLHPPEGEPLPKITLTIFHGAHGSVQDARAIEPVFRQCDIIIPEGLGWTPKHLTVANAISVGELIPTTEAVGQLGIDLSKEGYERQLLKMVYGSHKPIAYIDYPAEDEEEVGNQRSVGRFIGMIPLWWVLSKSFEYKIESIKLNLEDFAQSDKKREDYMISMLQPIIRRTIANNPSLSQKAQQEGQLNTLLILGAAHTAVSHSLERQGFKVSREFSQKPFVYPYFVEGIRRYRFDKKVDNDLAARIFIEVVIASLFRKELQNAFSESIQDGKFTRGIVSRLSYQDIKTMSDQAPRGPFDSERLRQSLLVQIHAKTPALNILLRE